MLVAVGPGCDRDRPHPVTETESLDEGAHYDLEIQIVPRTPYLATYPCSGCHANREPDSTPRALTAFHAGRTVEHGPAIHWCDDCHSITEPDHLIALDGVTAISFDESDALCGQCHGEKHRDWEAGMHGSTVGAWHGTARRRVCTACHDPHAPGDFHLEALPPPIPDPRTPRLDAHRDDAEEGEGT